MNSLGQQVEARRLSLSLLQSDVADLAQVSERFVREVEHDKSTRRLDKLVAVLEVLGLRLTTERRPSEQRGEGRPGRDRRAFPTCRGYGR